VSGREHIAIGKELFSTILDKCSIRPADTVLDIGCGCGRIATPLADYLDWGIYDGIDIVLPMVELCRQNITPLHPQFTFHHADLTNTLYSATGSPASAYVFPFRDERFDVVFATSVLPTCCQPLPHNTLARSNGF
jgi:SAM-dependent methyltransferase